MKPALLFDLDETLMVEEQAAAAAFYATARFANTRYPLDPEGLAAEARVQARDLWYAAPTWSGVGQSRGALCSGRSQGSD